MRRPLIAGNWKMHGTIREAVALVEEIRRLLQPPPDDVEVAVCPPFTALAAVRDALAGSGIKLGAQNVHEAPQGAYTGEISLPMLQELGCEYVILGHSERRQYFGETDAGVNRKAKAALEAGVGVIVCVGETLEERRDGRTESVVTRQVRESLAGVPVDDPERLVVAYEPVWAIGTGENASGAQANETIAVIRRELSDMFGRDLAASIRILYGGSVKPENIGEFMAEEEIDGALVGGASLKAASFVGIVKGGS